ncbi:MAG: hypothetical protein KME17_28530 [Cyanosarcina radialis HA8281-LM2]|jgi:hypothetical protein|nr:hypothetical protein [Cyanosarcina radialis HA8281-LM2]
MKKKLFVSSVLLLAVGWGVKPLTTSAIARPPIVLAQSEGNRPANNSTPTAPAAPNPPIQTQVELLDPGVEPRQELRFQPRVNDRETAVMILNMEMGMSLGGSQLVKVKVPTNVITTDMSTTKVDDNGDIHAQFSYSDVQVLADEGVPPELVGVMRSQMKKLAGVKGDFVVDRQGKPKSANFVLPAGVDPTTKQMLDQFSSSINQLSFPLPAEPIGAGAKWRGTTTLSINGINLTQIATFKLTSIQDNVANLDVAIEQKADEQQLTFPGLGTTANVTLKSLNSQGQGKMRIRLDKLLPISANLALNSNTETSASVPGTSEAIATTIQLSMNLSIRSKN